MEPKIIYESTPNKDSTSNLQIIKNIIDAINKDNSVSKSVIIVRQIDDRIQIHGPTRYHDRREFNTHHIASLKNPKWDSAPTNIKLELHNFNVEKEDIKLYGDIWCARWMTDKFGSDCLKYCSLVSNNRGTYTHIGSAKNFDSNNV